VAVRSFPFAAVPWRRSRVSRIAAFLSFFTLLSLSASALSTHTHYETRVCVCVRAWLAVAVELELAPRSAARARRRESRRGLLPDNRPALLV